MDLQLNGKRALITGASRGLGYATAMLLAQEGCAVAINSRDPASISAAAGRISTQTGGIAVGLAGDIAQPSFPSMLVEQAAVKLGGLDILVTNSGGPPAARFESLDDEIWLQAIELVFLSHVRLIRAALPYLRKSDSPSILTFTSYSVKQPIPNLVLSNSIRAATVGLTKTLALELGTDGIRFNSILPAWTETERAIELMKNRAKSNQTSLQAETAKQANQSPFGRFATPEEFARVAVFLASPAASYVTGVMLTVDGGMYKGLM